MRYFLHLAYKGTLYRGWQRQTTAVGIQQILEEALAQLFHQKIHCQGCGRTDAGVHASQFFAHLNIEKELNELTIFKLNKILPDDIVAFDFIPMKEQAHAQNDALWRTYDYFIHRTADPFLNQISTLVIDKPLIISRMQQAAALLSQYRDYRSMCKRPGIYKHTNCLIRAAVLKVSNDKNRLHFRITADRFLKGMVRIIVGNLLEIGKGRMTVSAFEHCLKTGQPASYFNAAYPQGLYLSKVVYPYLDLPTERQIVEFLKWD